MKVIYKEKIGDHTIIRFVSDAVIDSEATKEKIAPMVTAEMDEKAIEKLFMENLVFSKVGPEAEMIDNEAAKQIQRKLDEKGKNQLLLENGDYLADNRGVEYWIEETGEWKKEKIEEIGVMLPSGAVLQENISMEQQQEINNQQEVKRISELTSEQKTEEKTNRLHAIAREAINKAEEAELLGETFDKKAWLKPKKAEIEKLYA